MIAFLVFLATLSLVAFAQEGACPYKNRGWSIEHWPMNTDSSEQCQTCTEFFLEQQSIWCNDTSVRYNFPVIMLYVVLFHFISLHFFSFYVFFEQVAAILDNLDKECKSKFSIKEPKKRKLCEAIANVAVQVPPGVIDGMMGLSWPLPEGLCATLFQCSVDCTLDRSQPPAQVHLSFTQKSDVYGVSWVTFNQTRSVVQYGLTERDLSSSNEGTTLTYLASDWKGTIHRALLTDLKPGRTYYYRVGNGVDSWSKIFNFKVLEPLQDVTFAVLGDMDFEANATIANIGTLAQKGNIQGVVFTGDISYADGYEPHWDRFFERVEVFAGKHISCFLFFH